MDPVRSNMVDKLYLIQKNIFYIILKIFTIMSGIAKNRIKKYD